ncbi:hypothetical protein [Pseudophaeobacter sp.]|uniref:hypothetical protein n=1 Tax=Pseudophaeobacter sp. TaxID=1971739 RepID=UPI004059CD08
MAKLKPIRERAARALCKLEGLEPDITMEGAPMWRSFLPEVDAVLTAALRPECWDALRDASDGLEAEHLQRPLNKL